MRNYLFFSCLLACLLAGFSFTRPVQAHPGYGFEIVSPQDEKINGWFSDPRGNYIFMASRGKPYYPGSAFVVKMNFLAGNIVQASFPLPDTATVLYAGFYTPLNTYRFFGVISSDTASAFMEFCQIWVLETDTNLNLISSIRYDLHPQYHFIKKMKALTDGEGQYILACETYDKKNSWHRDDVLMLRFNQGLLEAQQPLQLPLPQTLSSISIQPGSTDLSLVVGAYDVTSIYHMLKMDTAFNVLSATPLNFSLFISEPGQPLWESGGRFLIDYQNCISVDESEICLTRMSFTCHPLNHYEHVYTNTLDIPAFLRAVHPCSDGEYLLAGTLGFYPTYISSQLMVVKLDQYLEAKWYKYYGDTENYNLLAILPLLDGTFLMVATFYDILSGPYQRDLVFFRIDDNGQWLSAGTEATPGIDSFQVFPNPGTDVLGITAGSDLPYQVEVFDQSSRLLLGPYTLQGSGQIDVSSLKPGMYAIRLINNKSVVEVKKWVKSRAVL